MGKDIVELLLGEDEDSKRAKNLFIERGIPYKLIVASGESLPTVDYMSVSYRGMENIYRLICFLDQ